MSVLLLSLVINVFFNIWIFQALSVGIFPYVLKRLQSSARELRPLLVFIWAKILAVDSVNDLHDQEEIQCFQHQQCSSVDLGKLLVGERDWEKKESCLTAKHNVVDKALPRKCKTWCFYVHMQWSI